VGKGLAIKKKNIYKTCFNMLEKFRLPLASRGGGGVGVCFHGIARLVVFILGEKEPV